MDGLLGFGELQLAGDGDLDVADIVQVRGGGGINGGVGGENQRGWGKGMETIVGEKGGLVGGGVNMVVVGKLGDGEPGGPIVVKRGDIGTEDLLDGAVDVLGLAIGFRVMRGGDVEFGAKGGEEGLPEGGGDAGISVRNHNVGQALFG